MPRNRKHYIPTGRRNHGRPLKRLMVTWDRKGSTSGPTAWQIYDDDDDVLEYHRKGIMLAGLLETVCYHFLWVFNLYVQLFKKIH